jgi:hypothetical protein
VLLSFPWILQVCKMLMFPPLENNEWYAVCHSMGNSILIEKQDIKPSWSLHWYFYSNTYSASSIHLNGAILHISGVPHPWKHLVVVCIPLNMEVKSHWKTKC